MRKRENAAAMCALLERALPEISDHGLKADIAVLLLSIHDEHL